MLLKPAILLSIAFICDLPELTCIFGPVEHSCDRGITAEES